MNTKGNTGLPTVSVGILTCNRKEELRITLLQIMESVYPNLEIIVVVNGSTDSSAEMVKSQFPHVKLYESERNIGIAARNIILFQASGKYLVQYDDDSMPSTPSTIGDIVSFLERHADVAALCTNVTNYHTGKSETRGWEKYAVAEGGDYYEGLLIHGAGTAFRTECIQQTHGFPEDFFLWAEEGDLALQMAQRNFKIVYKPDIVTYHRVSPIRMTKSWAFLMYTRNQIWLFWKYFPVSLAFWLTFAAVLGRLAFTRGRPTYLLSFCKGVYLGLRGIPMQRRKGMVLDKETIKKTKKWQRQNLVVVWYPIEMVAEVFKKLLPK